MAYYNGHKVLSVVIGGGGSSGGNLAKAIEGSLNSENYSLTAGDMSGVTKIGAYKFYRDTKLTAIDLSSVTEIGDSAFYIASNLTSVDLSNVDTIGVNAFCSTGLTSLNLKNADINIMNSAFSGCGSLSTLTIPDLIEILPAGFISGCVNLTSLTIGKGITKIGNTAFNNLYGLTDLYYNVENLVFVGDTQSTSNCIFNDLGKNVANGTHLHIGDDVKQIPYNFLSPSSSTYYNRVKQITWGTQGKLTKINRYAFKYLPMTAPMLLPEGLLEVSANAFDWCSMSTAIEFPSTITSIGNSACNYMAAITYAKIKATTPPAIGASVFSNCNALVSIRVPAASLISYLGVANLSTYTAKIIGYQTIGLNNVYPDYSDGVNYTQTRWYANAADAIADTTGTGGAASGTVCYQGGEVYCKLFA